MAMKMMVATMVTGRGNAKKVAECDNKDATNSPAAAGAGGSEQGAHSTDSEDRTRADA